MSVEAPRHPRGYPERGKVFRLEQDDNGTTTLNGIPVIGTSVIRCNGSFSRVEHVIPGTHDIGRVFRRSRWYRNSGARHYGQSGEDLRRERVTEATSTNTRST